MFFSRSKRTKKIKVIIMAAVLAAVGTVLVVFAGYRRVADAPELLISSLQDGANLSLGKIKQTATRDGKKEWSLEADSALYIETENEVVLKNLFVTYYVADNREVYLDADEGRLHTDTNDIGFSGNVVVRNEKYRLRTERLDYSHDRRLISTDTPVHIYGDDSDVTAASMTYDLKAGKVVLTGDVVASISRKFASIQDTADR
jgi:LPS export ABC transporter protein LptC